MIRIILFLVLIALAGAGAAWVAEQPGNVVLTWGALRAAPSLPVFVLLLGLVILAAILIWSILRGLWRTPAKLRKSRHARHQARGRHAVTQGLLAIGHGDGAAARQHANVARRFAANDPLALLLHAQSAQLDGDRDAATRAFRAMAEREDTRLLGLRGLFIEAQRAEDPVAAVTIAEEALKLSPGSTWASQAVLGFRCAQNDWSGALAILDTNLSSGLIDKATFRRHRGVLLTARALQLETGDRDVARESVMEAIKLAPTLIPAAVLAAKFQSEAHQTRRALKIVEAAWLAQPHPDLADAYAHIKLGDSARQRLVRVETLAEKAPGHIESALAVARAAIDASEFSRARSALQPFVDAPTQRVAMLMAEIERLENGDSGRARAWTLRAVRATHDPVWVADGYVSDRWRPVSPVTGRLDAFQWQTPLAALPSDSRFDLEAEILRETVLAPPRRQPAAVAAPMSSGETPPEAPFLTPTPAPDPAAPAAPPELLAPTVQDNAPEPVAATEPETDTVSEPERAARPEPDLVETPPAAANTPTAPPPLFFRPRPDSAPHTPLSSIPLPDKASTDLVGKDSAGNGNPRPDASRPETGRPAAVPPVITIVRAPDDPGVDDIAEDEFAELNGARQEGGWRGFLARWAG
ncbi:heme biosynthesis HemY N-terminal domain-containing protein [soil metagenome]